MVTIERPARTAIWYFKGCGYYVTKAENGHLLTCLESQNSGGCGGEGQKTLSVTEQRGGEDEGGGFPRAQVSSAQQAALGTGRE